MSGISETYGQLILPGIDSVTFSPGSESGQPPCGPRAGPMTGQSGQEAVPVSRFRSLDSAKAMPINDTSGPLFNHLSPSADLQWWLESRLRATVDVNGSALFDLTWKHWDMPSGPPICALRARVRRTSGSGCTGWPTTAARDYRTPNLKTYAERGGGRKGEQLPNAVHHLLGSGSNAQTGKPGRLNPAFSLWLMLGDKATEWLSCVLPGTRSTSTRRGSSSGRS
jgi:hypothetical protein